MNVEKLFGSNAGKVWQLLSFKATPLSAGKITKETKMDREDVYGALGWLAREGKIETVTKKDKGKDITLYRLVDGV